jgi:DNA-binding LytR/AlgR family response regulator
MMRVVVIEGDNASAQFLSELLAQSGEIEILGVVTNWSTGLQVCQKLGPEAVFLDVDQLDDEGGSLPTQLAELPQAPRLVFMAKDTLRAPEAFRVDAVDYLLKPFNSAEVSEAIHRLRAQLRPTKLGLLPSSPLYRQACLQTMSPTEAGIDLLPVTDANRDQIRLLARHEIVAVLRKGRRTWIHTVLQEFATYYSLTHLVNWLGGGPFLQIGRHAVVNLFAVEKLSRTGPRRYRLKMGDRLGTIIMCSRSGAAQLTTILNRRRPVQMPELPTVSLRTKPSKKRALVRTSLEAVGV